MSFSSSKKKVSKKSLSEVLNEQLGHKDRDLGDSEAFEQPPVEEDIDGEPRSLGKKSARSGGLRRRGALDDELTAGKYAAKPVSREEIESRMDDIFGALDEDDGDEDDLFDDEDAVPAAGGKKKKISTQEEFEAMYEKKSRPAKKVRADGTSIRPEGAQVSGVKGASAAEDDLLTQIKQLRARQKADMSLVDGEGDAAEGATSSSGAASSLQSAADILRASVAVYQHLLHARVKLQPLVQRAVRFPQSDVFSQYSTHIEKCAEDDAISPDATFEGLASELKVVIADLLRGAAKLSKSSKSASLANAVSTMGANSTAAQLYSKITDLDKDFEKDVHACIEHWGARTAGVAAKGGAFKAIHQPLLDQIRAVIVSKTRLLNKAQRNRSHVAIFGHANNEKTAAERAADIAAGDIDEEIFDDADFVKELVHRSGNIRLKNAQTDVESEAAKDLKASGIGSRSGMSQRTKGRAISYQPHPKLVAYMAPVPFSVGQQHEALLRSLFQ